MWILENANCIKGKGLEGQFVYGWDGKELLLVPVDSPDYQEIERKNKIFHSNDFIKAKDLKVGATYLSKTDGTFVYMGKFDKNLPIYLKQRSIPIERCSLFKKYSHCLHFISHSM